MVQRLPSLSLAAAGGFSIHTRHVVGGRLPLLGPGLCTPSTALSPQAGGRAALLGPARLDPARRVDSSRMTPPSGAGYTAGWLAGWLAWLSPNRSHSRGLQATREAERVGGWDGARPECLADVPEELSACVAARRCPDASRCTGASEVSAVDAVM